jgi:hypothetical protein
MKVDKAQMIGFAAVALALSLYNNPLKRPLEWGDFLMFGLLGLLMWWLLSARKSGDAPAQDGADQSFAFRLGKSLNRIRRGKGV